MLKNTLTNQEQITEKRGNALHASTFNDTFPGFPSFSFCIGSCKFCILPWADNSFTTGSLLSNLFTSCPIDKMVFRRNAKAVVNQETSFGHKWLSWGPRPRGSVSQCTWRGLSTPLGCYAVSSSKR